MPYERIESERIERVRAGFEAFNEDDWDKVLVNFADDAELQRAGSAGMVHGKDAIRKLWAPDAFEWQRARPTSFREDANRVLAVCEWWAKGRESGAIVRSTVYFVFSYEDELVTRLEIFFDADDALAASGLAP
jgi:ketosteroid isomerase-like protein